MIYTVIWLCQRVVVICNVIKESQNMLHELRRFATNFKYDSYTFQNVHVFLQCYLSNWSGGFLSIANSMNFKEFILMYFFYKLELHCVCSQTHPLYSLVSLVCYHFHFFKSYLYQLVPLDFIMKHFLFKSKTKGIFTLFDLILIFL